MTAEKFSVSMDEWLTECMDDVISRDGFESRSAYLRFLVRNDIQAAHPDYNPNAPEIEQ